MSLHEYAVSMVVGGVVAAAGLGACVGVGPALMLFGGVLMAGTVFAVWAGIR